MNICDVCKGTTLAKVRCNTCRYKYGKHTLVPAADVHYFFKTREWPKRYTKPRRIYKCVIPQRKKQQPSPPSTPLIKQTLPDKDLPVVTSEALESLMNKFPELRGSPLKPEELNKVCQILLIAKEKKKRELITINEQLGIPRADPNATIGGSTHAYALQDALDTLIHEDSAWLPILQDIQKRMNDRFYGPTLLDFAVQKWAGFRGGKFDLYDAFAFSKIHSLLCEGKVAHCQIHVGSGPGKDKDIEGNNRLLQNLPEPFTACFQPQAGSGDNDDGYVEWESAVEMVKMVLNADGTETASSVIVPVQRVPLEVGTTAASRTIHHLNQNGALARWPYGHEWLLVWVKV